MHYKYCRLIKIGIIIKIFLIIIPCYMPYQAIPSYFQPDFTLLFLTFIS